MKKILAIVLALAMILSLAACGSKAEEISFAYSYSRLYFSHSLRSVSLSRISFIISG